MNVLPIKGGRILKKKSGTTFRLCDYGTDPVYNDVRFNLSEFRHVFQILFCLEPLPIERNTEQRDIPNSTLTSSLDSRHIKKKIPKKGGWSIL